MLETHIAGLLRRHPVVCLLGARQVGKTTLARRIVKKQRARATLYDLENPDDLARLSEPLAALRRHQGLIVIDEVQRAPNLFSVLRVSWPTSARRSVAS
jgi:predicted AAA+ superfamily ATPase